MTNQSAADELGAVGRAGEGGDTPQGPRLESQLTGQELIVVGLTEPVVNR